MLKRLPLLLLAVLLTLPFLAPAASAQNAASREVRTMLEQRDKEIKALLGNKTTLNATDKTKLKEVVNASIDFEAMGRQALGPHWNGLTAAQRTDFVRVFSEIVRNQSLSNLDIYRARVSYGDITVNGNQARAMTQVVYKEVPAKVEYVMGRKDGKWFVNDIILDNVSTAGGYERSFQSVVRKRGFDALMTSLRKKLDGMNKAS